MKSIKRLLLFAVLGGCMTLVIFCDNVQNGNDDDTFVEGVDAVITSPSNVDLTSKNVPEEPIAGASQDVLFKFAWEQFVALNWPVADPSIAGNRGKPSSDPNVSFVGIEQGNTPVVVWHTYASKAEMFGPAYAAPGKTLPEWSSLSLPKYSYTDKPPKKDNTVNYQLFNNLDENNEIGQAFVWGGAGHGDTLGGNQVLYEAKANMVEYEYIRKHNLQRHKESGIWRRNSKKIAALEKYGGVCNSAETDAKEIVCLPCDGEGTIEIKAGWRELNGGDKKDRYFTQDVLLYENINGNVVAVNKTYALIGLHIIRKTTSYPTFIFTTFNHVDNIETGIRFENEMKRQGKNLYFKKNAAGDIRPFKDTMPNTVARGSIPILKQEDIHPIQASLKTFNQNVQNEIKAANPESVWQYYELLGVQGTPTDINDKTPDPTYYLANNVIETDYILTRFTSAFHQSGILLGQPNVYYRKPIVSGGMATTEAASVNMGGCKGCHGNAQVNGKDFSFLLSGEILAEPDTLGTSNEHLVNRSSAITNMLE